MTQNEDKFGFPKEFTDENFNRAAFVDKFKLDEDTDKLVDFLTTVILRGGESTVISSSLDFTKMFSMGQVGEQLFQNIVKNNTTRSEEDCWKCVNFILAEMFEGMCEFQENLFELQEKENE